MASALFDSHAFVKKLTEAGMPEAQAEVLAQEHARLLGEQLATKQDVAILRSDLERVKDQLTIRLGAMLAAAVVIVAGLVKLL
jgi:methylase of polypeptide subunit release factors